ncbi:MAG: hypothetical protein C0596_17555 [Marinilabiliales bacterium]|nr:MAG: hypothetical protein C0596_17555 [Marinilabiliales bacterium]
MTTYTFNKKYINLIYRNTSISLIICSLLFFAFAYSKVPTLIILFIISITASATIFIILQYINNIISEIVISGTILKINFFDQRRHIIEIRKKNVNAFLRSNKIVLKDVISNKIIGIIPKKQITDENAWYELKSVLKTQ